MLILTSVTNFLWELGRLLSLSGHQFTSQLNENYLRTAGLSNLKTAESENLKCVTLPNWKTATKPRAPAPSPVLALSQHMGNSVAALKGITDPGVTCVSQSDQLEKHQASRTGLSGGYTFPRTQTPCSEELLWVV